MVIDFRSLLKGKDREPIIVQLYTAGAFYEDNGKGQN
jgi:hypothetical protein